MAAEELGLFPLGAVLVPGEVMPLHIFEERYRDLVADCLEHDRPFVMLYADEEGARELGTTARVTEVLERFEDGRLNIAIEGGEVVRVVEITRGRSFMTGRIEAAEDDLAAGDERSSAIDLYNQVAEAAGAGPDPEVGVGEQPVSFAIAARIEFPAAEKQRILELRQERARLEVISELLTRGLQNIELAERIRERASGNGKLPEPGEELS
jgi:Lon protease-like protein